MVKTTKQKATERIVGLTLPRQKLAGKTSTYKGVTTELKGLCKCNNAARLRRVWSKAKRRNYVKDVANKYGGKEAEDRVEYDGEEIPNPNYRRWYLSCGRPFSKNPDGSNNLGQWCDGFYGWADEVFDQVDWPVPAEDEDYSYDTKVAQQAQALVHNWNKENPIGPHLEAKIDEQTQKMQDWDSYNSNPNNKLN